MKTNMILSASGWRKVFAASGDEQDRNPEITEQDKALSVACASVFFDYLSQKINQECPVIAVGIDARPTGPALAAIRRGTFVTSSHVLIYSASSYFAEIGILAPG